ncbi:hypothetical protein [Dokdonia sp.]|uniref:hypothetical protein n=1 Tax=Dokdonia sp. TaxID=2024995 RepID=UPI003265BF2A
MSDFKLNIEDSNLENDNNDSTEKREFLADLDIQSIARVFTNFKKENRILIIPIGFPQAGKSLLLSSLMYYSRKGEDTLFKTNLEDNFPFDKGRIAVDEMIKYFNEGKLYEATAKNTLDLIGINLEPSKNNIPNLNLAFLDLAGEDIKKIKLSEGLNFTEKISAVFNGLKIDNSPVIFTLITPYRPALLDNETLQSAHDREDTLHYDFLNYIEMNQPHLLKSSKFFVIVSQWDNNPNENEKVEDYIAEKRPSIYNYVKNKNVVWGEYSIGKLLESEINGLKIQEIVRINRDYPARYWKKLYQICTGKELDKKTWLQKLFG